MHQIIYSCSESYVRNWTSQAPVIRTVWPSGIPDPLLYQTESATGISKETESPSVPNDNMYKERTAEFQN